MQAISLANVLRLYAGGIAYALLSLLLGKYIVPITIMIGFGLPMIIYLAMDFIACPVVAALMGFQSRWSILGALLFGAPLVALYTFVSPVAIAGSPGIFYVVAPWLAAIITTKVDVQALLIHRLGFWAPTYLFFLALGIVSRWIVPVLTDNSKDKP